MFISDNIAIPVHREYVVAISIIVFKQDLSGVVNRNLPYRLQRLSSSFLACTFSYRPTPLGPC